MRPKERKFNTSTNYSALISIKGTMGLPEDHPASPLPVCSICVPIVPSARQPLVLLVRQSLPTFGQELVEFPALLQVVVLSTE
mmetsp:Transcript_19979/g.42539  ORF Transcript_19979/g.42539 Transcript_19979/m.42539 type:complete len:83 (-) Transcript_19979:668-916(-)